MYFVHRLTIVEINVVISNLKIWKIDWWVNPNVHILNLFYISKLDVYYLWLFLYNHSLLIWNKQETHLKTKSIIKYISYFLFLSIYINTAFVLTYLSWTFLANIKTFSEAWGKNKFWYSLSLEEKSVVQRLKKNGLFSIEKGCLFKHSYQNVLTKSVARFHPSEMKPNSCFKDTDIVSNILYL